ncbi:E3 ubiquitin-protein ligase RNF4 [Aedes aegypti]|uniref:RING-type domain-containing protein n=1 Tax=Aedes aegypti TaxID=7159 RepID=A0A1S4F8U8_AEDAE|nr:E3 ubiquitin-protein ligase RNF4 [Aedes aegypti]
MDNSVENFEDLTGDTDPDPDDTMVNVIERAEALLASLPVRKAAKKPAAKRRATGTKKEPSAASINMPGPSTRVQRIPSDDSDCVIVVPDSEESKPPTKTSAVSEVPSSAPASASEGISCPICFDPVFQGPAASTICGHLYCHECITVEIKVRPKCPMCSRPLQEADIIQLFRN